MFSPFRVGRLAALALVSCAAAFESSHAQISFSSPNNGTTPVAHCQEYFSYEWNQPLDMSGSDNGPLNYVPAGETRDINGFSYSNGTLSFTTTGPSAVLTLLQTLPFDQTTQTNEAVPVGSRYGEVHPINSSLYHRFVVRMNSSLFTTASVIWGMNNYQVAAANFQVYPGWHTYELDMNNVTVLPIAGSSLNWTDNQWQDLVLMPTNSAGVSIDIDYVMLESDTGCGSGSIAFSATAQNGDDRFAVVADNDTDFSNGNEVGASGVASGSQTFSVGTGSSNFDISKLHPGAHNIYGFLSGDWATLSMFDPWDMSSASDVNPNQISGISNVSFSSGAMNGTVTSDDPSAYLNLRGNTIDASIYKQISIGVSYTFPNGVSHDSIEIHFVTTTGSGFKRISNSTNSGSNVYTATLSSADGWSGQVTALRIDPTNSSQAIGTRFALDFVAIRDSGFVSSLNLPTLVQAPANLIVNNPTLAFLQPDEHGGRDFAQTVLGKSWNMNSSDDVALPYNVSTATLYPNNVIVDAAGNTNAGAFYRTENIIGNGDPNLTLLLNATPDKRVNTQTFLNMCFRAFNMTDTTGYNSVARFIFHDTGDSVPSTAYKSGDDIIMNRGSREYCLDLSQGMFARTEPLEPNHANAWTSISARGGTSDVIRIDLNEEEQPFWSVLDYLHLRTDHESNSQYAISVTAPLSETVGLYYSPTSGGSEVLFGTMAAGRNTNEFLWNTSAMAEGKYNISAHVTANGNTFIVKAPGRVDISHGRAQDTTPPALNCDRPGNGYDFDSSLEVAGYALDETRLASVEVSVDGTYLTNFKPDIFSLAARNQFPNYAENNNPGFQKLLDARSISYGTHTVTMTAYDTAGNTSSCSAAVTRRAGANTSPFVYPANDASPQSVALNVPTPTPPPVSTPVPQPVAKVGIDKKGKATYTVTGAGRCPSVQLIAGTNANLAGAVTLFTTAGKSSIVATTKVAPLFKKPAKSKEKGVLYLKAQCSGGQLSQAVKMNLTRVKSKNILTTEKKALNYLRTHTKVSP